MMPTPVLPDVVGITIAALRAQTAVTAFVGTRIYDRVPASPVYPLLVVSAVDDDESADAAIGVARVQIDVWGAGGSQTNVAEARLIARTLRSVARDMRGVYTGSPAATGSIVVVAPAAFIAAFDPDTGRARFICDLFVSTHA